MQDFVTPFIYYDLLVYISSSMLVLDSRDRQGNIWLPKNTPESKHHNNITDFKSQQYSYIFIELFNHLILAYTQSRSEVVKLSQL